MTIICAILGIYRLVLVGRALVSFFPVTPGTAFAQIAEVLFKLTEPVLAPMRRFIPPIGMFDVSFLVVLLLLSFVSRAIGCRGAFL